MAFIVRRVPSEIVEKFLRSKVEITKKSPLESFDNNEDADPYMVGYELEDTKTQENVQQQTVEKTAEKHLDNKKKTSIMKHGKSNNKEFERD
ncbi:MAG: hypothetical protein LBG88_03160 [Christensenellaceae bacterium]|jgi:hypothetical protein|nr:hypothetical protein [Christensenellaceae bacterium]